MFVHGVATSSKWAYIRVMEKCFACDRPLYQHGHRLRVDTRDSQIVFVGRGCFEKIKAAGDAGYQPPLGGPRLYPMPIKPTGERRDV